MASLTVANMRALGQALVRDTTALATSDWLLFLNDAMFAFATINYDDPQIWGLIDSLSIAAGASSKDMLIDLDRTIGFGYIENQSKQINPVGMARILRERGTAIGTGTPEMFATIAKSVGATNRTVTLQFDKQADTTYTLDVYGSTEPTALTGDSDLTPFGHNDSRVIARMASIDAARALGRHHEPGFMESLAGTLSDRIKRHYSIQPGVGAERVVA